MKRILFLSGLFTTLAIQAAVPQFKAGSWQLHHGACSNPSYVPSPDENAFWEAVKSGKSVDNYTFQNDHQGVYTMRMEFDFGAYCTGVDQFEVNYTGDGAVEMRFAGTKWTTHVPKPNMTVTCNDEGPHTEKLLYRWEAADLVFYRDGGPKCGEFAMVWAAQ